MNREIVLQKFTQDKVKVNMTFSDGYDDYTDFDSDYEHVLTTVPTEHSTPKL
jgi:hypothetical protein